MRQLAVSIGVVVAFAASSAAAEPTLVLTANAFAGACGGSVSCIITDDKTNDPAAPLSTLASATGNTLTDGSYADAHSFASFGTEKVYADAFRANASILGIYGDAQAKGEADFEDFAPAATIMGNNYQFKFAVGGTATPTDQVYGAVALGAVFFQIYDSFNGARLDYGQWISNDANQSTTILRNVFVPTGHGVDFKVQFEADAYTNNVDYGPGVVDQTLPVVADFSHTLHVYVDPLDPGGSIAFASGHDYATPVASGTPEPATWALLIAGFGATGTALRRRGTAALAFARAAR